MNQHIWLVHHFTREIKALPVEHIARTYVSIRWGQSGIYDLNLKDNVLTARSKKAQRKGKPLWSAADIEVVRKLAKDHFDGEDRKAEIARLAEQHKASMPGAANAPYPYAKR